MGGESRVGDGLAGAQHMALIEVHVEVAVAIVVEQRHPGAHVLEGVELARHAVEMHEVEAGLSCSLDEGGAGGRRRLGWGRLGCRRRFGNRRAAAASAGEQGDRRQTGWQR